MCVVIAGLGLPSGSLNTVRVSGSKDWYSSNNTGAGFSLPSRVVVGQGGVRNPALLNKPVLASHRDPQPAPRDHRSGYQVTGPAQQGHSVQVQTQAGRPLSYSNYGGSVPEQRAQHERGLNPGVSYSPNRPAGLRPADPESGMRTLAALLGNSNLSAAAVSQLCSLLNSPQAGNLNQLSSRLQLATQMAQGNQPEPVVETTHRVVIPEAHLKEGCHASSRQNAFPPVSHKSGATVADVGGQPQHGRAAEAKALPPKPVVGDDAASQGATDDPSELLM